MAINLGEIEKKNQKKNYKNVGGLQISTDYVDVPIIPKQVKQTANKKKKEEKKWYQEILKASDAFEDGWQSGDLAKTVVNTVGDVASTAVKGGWNAVKETGMNVAGGIYWGLDKTGILPGAYDAFTDIERYNQDVAVVSDIDKGIKKANKATQDNSILGQTGRQALESATQSAVNAVVSKASGLPVWQANSLASGFRHEYANALNNGATKEQATASGLASGISEVLTEYLFSGFIKLPGTGSGIDTALGKATEKIGSNFLKTVAQYGINVGGEAFEEVLSGFGSALGQSLTYLKDDIESGKIKFKDIYSLEDALENAGMGALSAMFGSANPQTIQNIREGRNLVTGLTGTQQKYIDEIAQQRMVEAEKRNAKLNLIQKGKINQRTMTDFEKGRLADANKLQQVNLPGLSTKDMDLQQSAYKYGFNPNSEAVVEMKTLFDNRDIVGIFDADRFKGSNENAFWSRNENGKREVVLNPNASPDVLLEEIAIHELTHDLMSSENSQEIIDNQKIMDYVSTLDGYEEARAKVEKLYAKQTKGKTAEAKKAYIDEEIVADTLGKNIGSQEYIRRLIDDEPSIAKNIYDWVVNKVANKNGVKNEKAYWNNVKNNFEKAYNMEYQGKGSDTRHALALNSAMDKHSSEQNARLRKAYDLKKQGYSDDYIWTQTGTRLIGNEDALLYVDDLKFKNNVDITKLPEGTYKASEILDGDLLKNFKEIGNLDVEITNLKDVMSKITNNKSALDSMDSVGGSASLDEGIKLNSKYINDNKNNPKLKQMIEELLSHEVQHIIQDVEYPNSGETLYFGIDKNTDEIFYFGDTQENAQKAYRNHPKEIEAEVTNLQNAMTKEQRHKFPLDLLFDEVKNHYKNNIVDIKTTQFINELEKKYGKDLEKWYTNSRNGVENNAFKRYTYGNQRNIEDQKSLSNSKENIVVDVSYGDGRKTTGYLEDFKRKSKLHDGSSDRTYKELDNSSFFNDLIADAKFHNAEDLTEVTTGYENVPDNLLGFSSSSVNNKGYNEEKYKYKLDLMISFDDGKTYFEDSIKGLNKKQAIERARRNWGEDAILKASPSSNNDIRYSLSDNQGRELTKEQQEFFKDSKVRDSEGNLRVLYNGSGNHTVYLPGYMSDESLWGKGVYLTPYKDIASDYGNDVKETYVNITKPMSHNTKMPFKQYNEFYKAINDGEEAYQEDYDMYDNDFDLLWDATNKGSWADYANELKQYTGYDGIIAEEIDGDRTSSMVIAFQSNQIKNVDNTNPTSDADIRNSQQTEGWQSFLDKNFEAQGTKTRLSDIKLPGLTKAVQEEVQKPVAPKAPKVTKPVKNENLPLRKETAVLKLDANQIADALNGSDKEGLRTPNGKKVRKWSNTSTNSDVLKDFIGIEDLDINKITYVPVSNKKTIDKANDVLSRMGYEEAIQHVKEKISEGTASLTDIAIAEELIVEARNRQDTQMVADLLMDVSILGTELGQKVQALSLIKKMTPEGQLKMYQKIITRAKAKGNKGFQDVEITPTMVNTILDAYDKNGNFNQDDLNQRVEVFKQQVAEQMKSTVGEQLDEWRYLSMLGNPKTHIRNVVSNVAMKGTLSVKNAIARTIEMALPQAKRTKTWEQASSYVKGFAEQTAEEWKGIISGESKYSETQQLNKMKKTFKSETLNKLSNLNSNLLEVEDWLFSKSAFKKSLQEYLTAQGIKTEQDISNNAEIVEKAKMYALEQAQIATFRQYSWLANKINEIENKSTLGKIGIGAVMPFKKTPINVAKAGIKYSPLGFIKNLIYDIPQLKNGNINASQLIDNVSQSLTGTSLMLLGYALAQAGFITGGGDDDKESKFDSALGNQTYALKFGNNTYSISWLSPVAMPLLVGANAFKEFNEKEEWDMNVLVNSLASTLDPISEMSFVSGLTNALQSYQQGSIQMIQSIGESAVSSYVTQFFPTLFSQIASVFDDKKRSTRASGDSKFKYGEELFNQIRYKIPGLRNTLPVATDIWGNEQKQAENIAQRAFETFIAPYNRKSVSNTALDKEIKRLYSETGETAVIPGTPKGYIQYRDERYDMNNAEYVAYKKTYGTKANSYLNSLIATDAYKSATDEEKSKMVQEIYGYAGAYAKKDFFSNREVEYTSDEIKAINKFEKLKMNSNDVGEFVAINKLSSTIKSNKDLDASDKRTKTGELMINAKLKDNQLAYLYSKYYSSEEKLDTMLTMEIPIKQFIKFDVADIQGKYNSKTGKTINGSKRNATIEYVNGLNLSKAQKAILIKDAYNTYDRYNNDIIRYVNNLSGTANDKKVWLKSIGFDNYDRDVVRYIKSQGLSQEETEKKLKDLGFTIRDGRVYY